MDYFSILMTYWCIHIYIYIHTSIYTDICPWLWEFILGAQLWTAGKDNPHHRHVTLRLPAFTAPQSSMWLHGVWLPSLAEICDNNEQT